MLYIDMKKLFYLLLVSNILFFSCRPSDEPAITVSEVESYSPGYVKVGDTVQVLGIQLENANVYVGGVLVDVVEEDFNQLKFVVDSDVTSNSKDVENTNYIRIDFEDGGSHQFSFPLVVNYVIQTADKASGWLKDCPQDVGDTLVGPAQLLLTDFDDSGVRNAFAVDQSAFDRIQFQGLSKDGGILAVDNFSQVSQSPGEGDFLGVNVDPSYIAANSAGFAAEFVTRSERRNDEGLWPNSFYEYPNSTLSSDGDEIYLNFCVFKNSQEKGVMQLWMYNNSLIGGSRYRANYFINNSTTGLNEWTWLSLPLSDFKTGFGFGTSLDLESFAEQNILKLDWVCLLYTSPSPRDA